MYRRHAAVVYRYALLLLRSPADAEDVTQTTFVRAYRALRRGSRVRNPKSWLLKIAHNECLRHLGSPARGIIPLELDEAMVAVPEDEDGPTAAEIRDALEKLGFNQRAALVMRELEDRSYAEIAEVLGLSVSAVETLLFRARRALREQLEGDVACADVELLLSKQIDGELAPDERRRLRAHVRGCASCATLERSQRGRRAALRRLGGAITLPSSLGSFAGGGGGVVAGGVTVAVGAKAAAVVVAALTVTGVGVGACAMGTAGGNGLGRRRRPCRRSRDGSGRGRRPSDRGAKAGARRTVVLSRRSRHGRARSRRCWHARARPTCARPARSTFTVRSLSWEPSRRSWCACERGGGGRRRGGFDRRFGRHDRAASGGAGRNRASPFGHFRPRPGTDDAGAAVDA